MRTSDTIVTITLTANTAYNITANETITVTVPDSALVTASAPVEADTTFNVTFATCPSGTCWDGGGSTNNWSEGANWTGNTVSGQHYYCPFQRYVFEGCNL